MSGTPETDDIARGNHVVPTEWAQQLERERDEARELHGKALSEREATEKEVDEMLERSLKAERERDEAREKMADALQEVDLRTLDFERMKQEREEAREKAEQQRKEIVRLNGATNHAGGTPLKIALKERDDAREEVRLLKGILDVIKKEAQ